MKKKITIGKIVDYKNFIRSINYATRGRFKTKQGATTFCRNLKNNYDKLRLEIVNSKYYVKDYSKFIVNDTKPRIIHAPCFVDKIVQYMVNNVLRDVVELKYIKDSYACIRTRGHHACVLRYSNYVKISKYRYRNPMLIKIDLSKFFYSINRSIIFNIICKHIKDERTRVLISKMLRFSEGIKGLPLGNLTSQQFANILLNEFDWYVKRTLRIKYYVRYADDMYMLVDGKYKAKEIKNKCIDYLVNNLDLVCNPKKCYISNTKCVSILGFKSNEYGGIKMLTRNKNKLFKIKNLKYVNDRSYRSTLRRDKYRNKKSTIRRATNEDKLIRLNSWYAHNKIAECVCWANYVFNKKIKQDFIFEEYLNKFIICG